MGLLECTHYCVCCDSCEDLSDPADSPLEAQDLATSAGWRPIALGKWLCAECRQKWAKSMAPKLFN